MQLYYPLASQSAGIIGLSFSTLCEDDVQCVLAMRNDKRVASFMYVQSISLEAHREFIDSLKDNPRSKYWLFKCGSVVLGVGSLSRISLHNAHAYVGVYTNPFLSKQQRSALCKDSTFSSVGEMILAALEQAGKQIGLHALYLEVLESNAHARAFYERSGFILQGRLREFIRANMPANSLTLAKQQTQESTTDFVNVCIYGKMLTKADSRQEDLDLGEHSHDFLDSRVVITDKVTPTPKSPQSLVAVPRTLEKEKQTESAKVDSSNATIVNKSAQDSSSKAQSLAKLLLVAEISANHNQSLRLAKHTIKAAKIAGADFIKLQTYTPECLSIDSTRSHFRIDSGTLWDGESLYDLYQKAYTPFAWHKELFDYARGLGVGVFSSPFSAKALELLESLECPMYKIASFEITDTPLIKLIASTKKPIIISTGIATHQEILEALQACYDAGNDDITLLLCTSSYPAPLESAQIASMPSLARYGVKYGLSDHTQGDICALLACALGASMIEKHFIIRRSLGGVDAEFSMEAREFQALARKLKSARLALGSKDLDSKLESNANSSGRAFARSLFICEDIKKGQILTPSNIRSIRPSGGLSPKFLPEVLGKRASRDLEKGSPLSWQDFS
ncbi:MAG: pseudaminic acid synthase [Helicobacter sp.]|nr:pseudaminic acid synthase [Helicobacter sp.]